MFVFDEAWKRLSNTVRHVIAGLPLAKNIWNDGFLDVYSICIAYPQPFHGQLYTEITKLLEDHVKKLYEEVEGSGPDILSVYAKHWKVYYQGSQYLNLLFRYFNQLFVHPNQHSLADIEFGTVAVEKTEEMVEIQELALKLWKSVMIKPLQGRLVNRILSQILKHRNGEDVHCSDCSAITDSFISVEEYNKKSKFLLYETLFQEPFLEQTGTFYKVKALELLETLSCSDYMKQILWYLTEEEMRSTKFLNQHSYKKAAKECQQRLVFDHVEFLQAGCKNMIKNEEKDDLLHMYLLLKSDPSGLKHMVSELETHIKETGIETIKGISKDTSMPVEFVESVLQVHKFFYNLVHELFHGDKMFVSALDRACLAVVNFNYNGKPSRAPELVCKYCDSILKKCWKGSTDDADEKLKTCIVVFRFIEDKDVFQRFYSRMLARRLINSTSAMDMEEVMINRLKDVCGYDFTSKLHCMFSDVRLSVENTKKFNDKLATRGDTCEPHLNINVLQAGAWPMTGVQSEFHLPEVLVRSYKEFGEFYREQYQGRNLTWLHPFSSAEVKMQITSKTYFVTLSTYQLAIVLLFNDADEVKMCDVTTSTNLREKDLERNVAALIDAKILKRSAADAPAGDLSSGSVVAINTEFVNKRTRFRVAQLSPTQREQTAEVQQTRTSVEEDRKLYLQAAIVRIMKARKSIHHNSLVEEVISRTRMRFMPGVSLIKRSIEALIDKSYIERAPDSTDTYRYLA